jgi:predicted membrane-bound mannosyltransferase
MCLHNQNKYEYNPYFHGCCLCDKKREVVELFDEE